MDSVSASTNPFPSLDVMQLQIDLGLYEKMARDALEKGDFEQHLQYGQLYHLTADKIKDATGADPRSLNASKTSGLDNFEGDPIEVGAEVEVYNGEAAKVIEVDGNQVTVDFYAGDHEGSGWDESTRTTVKC